MTMETADLYIPPMMANPLELGKPKHLNQWNRVLDGDWYMEPKLDGIRAIVVKGALEVAIYSRTKHELHDKVPAALIAELKAVLPPETVLDGELGYLDRFAFDSWPVLDFNATSRVTGSGASVAQAKLGDNVHKLRFWTFDVLRYQGRLVLDETQDYRRALLGGRVLGMDSLGYVRTVPRFPQWSELLYGRYVLNGGEGVMLKKGNAKYYPGARPTQCWYKVKKFETVDGVIVGYKPGQGKYEGQVGALLVNTPQGVMVAVSGMTDADRFWMTANWNTVSLPGKHCEIRFFGNVGQTGEGIRHPQFIRMRPDLD